MRISTSMLFDSNVQSMNDKTAALLHTQQQLSSGKRLLTAADDPVAAAQVLEVGQSQALNTQYQAAQTTAKNNLGLIDGQLSSVTDLLGRIRELGVQAGDAALSTSDRQSIVTELRSRFDELVGIANSTDGNGQYLFSGFQAGNKPFVGSVANGVTYAGDDGERTVRVSGGRLMATNVAGSDVFMGVKSGNGYFATAPQTAALNAGTGVIDAGAVSNPQLWNSANNSGQLEVRFWQDPTTSSTYYDLVDATTGKSLFSNTMSAAGGAGNTYTHAYTSGDPISFGGLAAPYNDFGASVTISGQPASGDVFTVNRSSSTSVFGMISDMINAISVPGNLGAAGTTQMNNQLGAALTNLSQVEDNVLRVRADVGARLSELDDLSSSSSSLDIQYKSQISGLQDVDYNKAITDLTQQQTQLQATQQSFAKISQMSLFNYLP